MRQLNVLRIQSSALVRVVRSLAVQIFDLAVKKSRIVPAWPLVFLATWYRQSPRDVHSRSLVTRHPSRLALAALVCERMAYSMADAGTRKLSRSQ